MASKNPVDGRAKITSQQSRYKCTCGNTQSVYVNDNDSVVITCTYCQTQYSVHFNTTIRKTVKQINKELGYDVSND